MLETLLRVENFYWAGDAFRPPVDAGNARECLADLQAIQGQFALAFEDSEDRVLLARDRLGINKLFFALHKSGAVVVANYLIDLVRRGVPFRAIYSVPAGHFVELDMRQRTLMLHQYFQLKTGTAHSATSLRAVAGRIREELECWFSRLAKEFGSRMICLNLSGGLDSGVIAAFAGRYFSNVMAYTYGFGSRGDARSEDVRYAGRLAEFLGIPFRMVSATSEDVLGRLEDAICYGQDWRDFNVHCAVVNEILASAIERATRTSQGSVPCLVLTGDLMNEFLADYSPVVYRGRTYYALPKVDVATLRLALIRGLNAGDREIGILNHHGLDVIQPYGFLLEEYLRLPHSLIGERTSKPDLVKAIAGDLLPPFMFERVKVRAQIGDSHGSGGILPLLVDSGRDAEWLKRAFCRLFGIEDETVLSRFILMGVYRCTGEFPADGRAPDGYYTCESFQAQGGRHLPLLNDSSTG